MPCENKNICLAIHETDITNAEIETRAKRMHPISLESIRGQAQDHISEVIGGCKNRKCYNESKA